MPEIQTSSHQRGRLLYYTKKAFNTKIVLLRTYDYVILIFKSHKDPGKSLKLNVF